LEAIFRKYGQPSSYTKSSQRIGGIPKIAEALRFGLVVARSEERLEIEHVIQDDKGGRAAVGGIIEAPLVEKDVEMNHVTIAKKSQGQPINHDEVAWEQNIDLFVLLAKDQAKDELVQGPNPTEMVGVSLDRTSQVLTYFYTAWVAAKDR